MFVCVAVCLSVTMCCGVTAERIDMPLGMEVDVGPVTKNKKGFPDAPKGRGNCPQKFCPHGLPSGPAALVELLPVNSKLPSGQLSLWSAEFLFYDYHGSGASSVGPQLQQSGRLKLRDL